MTKAAIKAVYADYKRVKSRKVHQIIFEVPSEEWPDHYKVLGEPNIDLSQWFGIAAMNVVEPAPTAQDNGVNLAANAAILLNDPMFQKFLDQMYEITLSENKSNYDQTIKYLVGINSKSELNTNPQKAQQWRELRAEYEAWKLAA